MGSRKTRRHTGATPNPRSSGGGPPWVLIGGVATVVVIAALVLYPSSSPDTADPSADTTAEAVERPPAPIASQPASPRPPANAQFPPLPLVPNLIPRSPEVISAAYEFAARNPDILEYVPCFCGCETAGHSANANCFVSSRHADGTVREWDTHGMSCIVCVDVARSAEQLHVSGASVRDIRTAIEAQYDTAPRMTPTPAPPAD